MFFIFGGNLSGNFKFSNFPSLLHLGLEWSCGFVLIILYLCQMISGVFLIMYLKVGLTDCLNSKFFMLREVFLGWFFSYSHSILVSFMFFLLYIHMFKCLFYNVYSYFSIWFSGFFLFTLFLLVVFTGYSLVLGTLGFWAMVIATGLMEFIFGEYVSLLLFSDFSYVTDLISYKMMGYHFFLSLSLGVLMTIHLILMHKGGSSIGLFGGYMDKFYFSSISLWKDLSLLWGMVLLVCFFLGYSAEYFFNLENFIELDLFKVPGNLEPEGFFKLVFSLLKGNESKKIGILMSGYSVIWFYLMNYFKEGLLSSFNFSMLKYIFLMIVFIFIFHSSVWPSKYFIGFLNSFFLVEISLGIFSAGLLVFYSIGSFYLESFVNFF